MRKCPSRLCAVVITALLSVLGVSAQGQMACGELFRKPKKVSVIRVDPIVRQAVLAVRKEAKELKTSQRRLTNEEIDFIREAFGLPDLSRYETELLYLAEAGELVDPPTNEIRKDFLRNFPRGDLAVSAETQALIEKMNVVPADNWDPRLERAQWKNLSGGTSFVDNREAAKEILQRFHFEALGEVRVDGDAAALMLALRYVARRAHDILYLKKYYLQYPPRAPEAAKQSEHEEELGPLDAAATFFSGRLSHLGWGPVDELRRTALSDNDASAPRQPKRGCCFGGCSGCFNPPAFLARAKASRTPLQPAGLELAVFQHAAVLFNSNPQEITGTPIGDWVQLNVEPFGNSHL